MTRALVLLVFLPLLQGSACSLTGGIDEEKAAARAERSAAARALAKADAKRKTASPIGTNLAPIADWSTQRPFADLFKQSRPWISNTEAKWDDERKLDVDARGWVKSLKPGQRARTLIIWDNAIPSGEHVVTWQGKGTIDFWPQQAVTQTGRAVIQMDPSKGGLALTITATDPRDPVRDIHVWRAGHEGKRFSPAFVESLRGYSTLRFMDWMETNDAKVVSFGERSLVDDARWTGKGVPLEVMIELCNLLDVDLWISVPDTWNDDAVAQAARLLQRDLEPALAIYVEHSNEVWNDMFPQAKRARAAGKTRSRDAHEARLLHHAVRSVEIFKIFEAAFLKDGARLVRTLGAHSANPWASRVMLGAPGVVEHTDALAIAPYFGHDVIETGLEGIFKALAADIDRSGAVIKEHKALADKARVQLIAYEGGQHMVGLDDEARTQAFLAANRDPRMKAAYASALRAWKDAGGGLFVHYFDTGMPGKFGSWGARDRVDQPRSAAPKLDALLTFAEATPAWW